MSETIFFISNTIKIVLFRTNQSQEAKLMGKYYSGLLLSKQKFEPELMSDTSRNFRLPGSKSWKYRSLDFCSRSYTQGLGAVVAHTQHVGVDIEYLKQRKIKLSQIASPLEIALIGAGCPVLNLYKIWTAKEACMKIVQRNFRFKDFELIDVLADNTWRMIYGKQKFHVNFYQLQNYILSIATV